MEDSSQYMAKTIQYCKVKKIKIKETGIGTVSRQNEKRGIED